MEEKLTLANGAAFMEKCLETELNAQRSAAHSAIDMDNWEKAQEILAVVKRNISLIENLKLKFAEFKTELQAAESSIAAALNISDNVTVSAEVPVPDAPIAGEELVSLIEEIIIEYPAPVMVSCESAEIGKYLNFDQNIIKTMKKPVSLSNGMSVDTGITREEGLKLAEKVRGYCKASN